MPMGCSKHRAGRIQRHASHFDARRSELLLLLLQGLAFFITGAGHRTGGGTPQNNNSWEPLPLKKPADKGRLSTETSAFP